MRFSKENPRPGPGRPKDRLSIRDVAKRRLMDPASKKIDMATATNLEVVVDQMMKNIKTMGKICEWADPGLRDNINMNVGFSDEFKRLITDREGVELAKQLSRRIQPGVGVTGSNGDAPGPGLAAAAAPGPA